MNLSLQLNKSNNYMTAPPPQFLKWVGNKQRFAGQIISYFPNSFNRYFEPFVGSGAILGGVGPEIGIAGDNLKPLIELWEILQTSPEKIIDYYNATLQRYTSSPETTYREVLDAYNASPNALDLLFICRSCYGGIVRFTKQGSISTPKGVHKPIPTATLIKRVNLWRERIKNTTFINADFQEVMAHARNNDMVYCDPPYAYSQKILYGAQGFNIEQLWNAIDRCKRVGAKVALSLDGTKKSGAVKLKFDIPPDLFEREIMINVGSSMLRRFQKSGENMQGEHVYDRLLLTW